MFKKKIPSCYINIPQATAPTLIGSIIVAATSLPKIIKTYNDIKNVINDTMNIITKSHDNDDDIIDVDSVVNTPKKESVINEEDIDDIFSEMTSDVEETATIITDTEEKECIEVG